MSSNQSHTGVKYLMSRRNTESKKTNTVITADNDKNTIKPENNYYHAWFSPKNKRDRSDHRVLKHTRCSVIYLDLEGKEVEVSFVSSNRNAYDESSLTDLKYIGLVDKYVRGVYS